MTKKQEIRIIALNRTLIREPAKEVFRSATARQSTDCLRPVRLFLSSFDCWIVQLLKSFSISCFKVPCSMFLLRRVKTKIFTLIEFLMRKSCKSGISFRQQQGRAERCQFADPASSFLLPLLNCSNVRLFDCFSLPSSFHVPCSSVLTSRGKTKVFTLIELLIIITC